MTHACEQITAAIAALLEVAPVAWGSVFETRLPTSRAVMPFLMVFDDGEPAEAISVLASGVYLRDLSVVVSGRLRLPGNNDTETVESRMSAVAAEAETKLTFAAMLVALPQLKDFRLTSIEKAVVTDEQAVPQYAEVTLFYLARYATAEGAPGTLI